jgi:hypothetical protein
MYVREKEIRRGDKSYSYWQVVESAWTENGPRQTVVAHLGRLPHRTAADVVARFEGHICGVSECGRAGTETTASVRQKRRYVEKPVVLCDRHRQELRSNTLTVVPLDREWRKKYKV